LDGWFHAKRHLGAVGHGFSAQLVDVGLVAVLDFDFILNVRKRERRVRKSATKEEKKRVLYLSNIFKKAKPYLVVESDEAHPDVLPFESAASAAGGGQKQFTRLRQFHVALHYQLGSGVVRPTEAIHRQLRANNKHNKMDDDEKTTMVGGRRFFENVCVGYLFFLLFFFFFWSRTPAESVCVCA
jgi:hypothetical protein